MGFDGKLLDGIVFFTQVVNSGSFTKAALLSGHSTSYISKEVSKLEERLGVRLLNRTTRSISLTPEGSMYYQQCEQLVEDANAAQNMLAGHQVEPQGRLRISCPVSYGLSKIRPILAKFMQRYPKVQVELDLNDRKVDLVADGWDLLIRASMKMEDSTLVSRKIEQAYSVTVAAPSYLSKHGTPSCPTELPAHATMSYSNLKQPNIWHYQLTDGRGVDVTVNNRLLTNSPEMELALCLAGEGITRVPSFNLTDELQTGKLVPLFTELPKQEIGVYVIYPSRKHMSSKVRHFIDFMFSELAQPN
ncbi:LysR family transcriptional regulator [Paraferrimonas haliotis]|uniref:LysR family transcriptional regulator n=1 Tax=Paraferrimonas haliotis TaxID=2013866 RepID=A0AA37TT88_9GAMM|nr:LysR family transcriptional regulator [Paraferrimonas haliotis]GLS82450.1 LysR family transcriptional regulator [Paraferrimonas haliotis]